MLRIITLTEFLLGKIIEEVYSLKHKKKTVLLTALVLGSIILLFVFFTPSANRGSWEERLYCRFDPNMPVYHEDIPLIMPNDESLFEYNDKDKYVFPQVMAVSVAGQEEKFRYCGYSEKSLRAKSTIIEGNYESVDTKRQMVYEKREGGTRITIDLQNEGVVVEDTCFATEEKLIEETKRILAASRIDRPMELYRINVQSIYFDSDGQGYRKDGFVKPEQIDVDEILKTLGLYEHRYKLPNQLSGGQQQRAAIGRAIVKNPDILLCDEPTGALDYNTSKEILKLIETVNQKYGNTIIMVTHNDAIKYMADRVIKLRDGVIRSNIRNTEKLTAEELEW